MSLKENEIRKILEATGYRAYCSLCGKRRIVYKDSESIDAYCAECIAGLNPVQCPECLGVVWDLAIDECPMCGGALSKGE